MQNAILKAIESEAKKRLSKHSRHWYYTHKYRETFKKRTGKKPKGGGAKIPSSWERHKHFDPRYCLNHSRFLAKGIWNALQNGTYKTTPSLRIQIPKVSGGVRTIDTFSIPDAAIAKIFLDRLRIRNEKIFSDSSYAYQHGKTPLDAVIRLRSSLESDVLFISQYDFSAYFDSIEHIYLYELISKQGRFLTTSVERQILNAVLTHDYVDVNNQTGKRSRGTPQGNSLSLFMSNVAAHPLDEELGRLNGTFARFADDSVVVNTSYEDALRTAAAFHRFSKNSGVGINSKKSTGIRMFSDTPMEMAHISEFTFLGYKFKRSGLYMGDRAKASIKRRCSKIIFNNLILHLNRTKSLSDKRIGKGFRDWDLVTCVNELRAFIYGGLNQSTLEQLLKGKGNIKNIPGAVSYFALIEDSSIFRELDGWLVDALHRAYKARIKMAFKHSKIKISSLDKKKLIHGEWYKFPNITLETKLPSFFSAWRAARKSWLRHGLGGIDSEGMGYAYL